MGETVGGAQSSLSSASQSVSSSMSTPLAFVPSGQQLTYFFILEGFGVLLLFLAFFIFAPIMILTPSKFAMSFTLGCLSLFAGFTVLRGWQQQLQHMVTLQRLPMSAAYVGSICATLYSAIIMHSYILCIVCSVLQVVAMLYYVLSYFPGGAYGVQFMLNMMGQAVMSCFGSISRMVLR